VTPWWQTSVVKVCRGVVITPSQRNHEVAISQLPEKVVTANERETKGRLPSVAPLIDLHAVGSREQTQALVAAVFTGTAKSETPSNLRDFLPRALAVLVLEGVGITEDLVLGPQHVPVQE
jgi:hypothetical protein